MTSQPSRRRSAFGLAALLIVLAACTPDSGTPSASPDGVSPSSAASASPSAAESREPVSLPPLPSGPDALDLERVAGPFEFPTAVTNAGDGRDWMFVTERVGRIRVVGADGTVAAQPFLDIVSRVQSGGERGLLGLAFHPDYRRTGRFFVNYTRNPDGATVIAEFRTTTDVNRVDPATERILMTVAQPAANHNGGALAFGPDSYLYIALGDGGGQGDQFGNAQDPSSLLGKLLRIDVDGAASSGRAYAIPRDNPFATGGGAPEVWAVGLRNPWRISFDRVWRDLYIGDVGGGNWEEVNRQPYDSDGGLNYGWPIMEGRHCLAASCTVEGFEQPIAEYSHGEGCSIIGGYVYRGPEQPRLQGIYIFGDWCSGRVFTLQVDEGTVTPKTVLQSGLSISSFGEDEAGEVYLLDFEGTGLYRVVVAD